MRRTSPCRALSILIALILMAAAAVTASPPDAVSLRVVNEVVPPGGVVQMKVEVTEPKPISTGRGRMVSPALPYLAGLVLMSPANDTVGIAVVQGTRMSVSMLSRMATFGTDSDYPILSAALRVPETTPIETVVPFEIEPGTIEFRDPSGVVYPSSVENGAFTVSPGVISIDDVIPGSADIPAGATVTILGRGFLPSTRVRFNEVPLVRTRYVSPRRIDVVLGSPARMHGMRIRAENREGPRVEYFSYQRTSAAGATTDPAFRGVIPLFAHRPVLSGTVRIAGHTALAIENLQGAPVPVTVELLSSTSVVLARKTMSVPPSRYVLRTVAELFPGAPPGGAALRVRSALPVEIMGVRVGPTGGVAPISAR